MAERGTRTHLTHAVDSGVDGAVASASRQSGSERAHKGVLLAAIVVAGRSMALAASAAIAAGRLGAREASAERLRVELGVLGATAIAAAILKHSDRAHEDAAFADTAGASLAAAWQGLAVVAASKAVREERDVAKAVDSTRKQMLHRIERTAATETAAAYNDEHRRALEDAIARDPDLAAVAAEYGVAWIWDAMLDKRTCENCEHMDGEVRGPGEDFSGGDPPAHAGCRCILIMTTQTESRKAA